MTKKYLKTSVRILPLALTAAVLFNENVQGKETVIPAPTQAKMWQKLTPSLLQEKHYSSNESGTKQTRYFWFGEVETKGRKWTVRASELANGEYNKLHKSPTSGFPTTMDCITAPEGSQTTLGCHVDPMMSGPYSMIFQIKVAGQGWVYNSKKQQFELPTTSK